MIFMNIGHMFDFALIFFVHIVPPGMGSPPTYPNGEGGHIRIYKFQSHSRRPCNKDNRII